jgi:hypothetical protein
MPLALEQELRSILRSTYLIQMLLFVQSTTELWVKMKGGLNLEVRKENAIAVSAKLAVSVNDFFDNMQDKFLQSFAFAMGIPLSRIQVSI